MIHLYITDESFQNIIEQSDIDISPLITYIHNNSGDMTYPWIASIDLYGDTIFNTLQREYLMEDLFHMRDIVENKPELLIHIDTLLALASELQLHEYLVCRGD